MPKYTIKRQQKFFWDKVAVTADDNLCWLWTGSLDKDGYGKKSWNSRDSKAHRVSWIIAHGEIPNGLWVLHKCDNPTCVNPKHLFLGTTQDNTKDRENKGRGANREGENNPACKLTKIQVNEIRERYSKGGITYRVLANEMNVSVSIIWMIVRYIKWRD